MAAFGQAQYNHFPGFNQFPGQNQSDESRSSTRQKERKPKGARRREQKTQVNKDKMKFDMNKREKKFNAK